MDSFLKKKYNEALEATNETAFTHWTIEYIKSRIYLALKRSDEALKCADKMLQYETNYLTLTKDEALIFYNRALETNKSHYAISIGKDK